MKPSLDNNVQYPEAALLLLVSKGDERAFRIIFDRYRQKIYSLAMFLTRSDFLSVEIVQEVFIKVWVNREDLATVTYFNAWLRTIARNTIKNYLRSLAREKLAMQGMMAVRERVSLSCENAVVEKQYQQILQEAIENLPPQQKKVYLLSRQAGLKNDEIAQSMNISIYTVKEYLAKARNALRGQVTSRVDMIMLVALFFYISG